MIKVFYYWTADEEGELCALDRSIVEQSTPCYHCGKKIPEYSVAVKLQTIDGEYKMHVECALKSCNQHPSEQGMHRRLEKFLQRYRD